jgi:hypothetical protein
MYKVSEMHRIEDNRDVVYAGGYGARYYGRFDQGGLKTVHLVVGIGERDRDNGFGKTVTDDYMITACGRAIRSDKAYRPEAGAFYGVKDRQGTWGKHSDQHPRCKACSKKAYEGMWAEAFEEAAEISRIAKLDADIRYADKEAQRNTWAAVGKAIEEQINEMVMAEDVIELPPSAVQLLMSEPSVEQVTSWLEWWALPDIGEMSEAEMAEAGLLTLAEVYSTGDGQPFNSIEQIAEALRGASELAHKAAADGEVAADLLGRAGEHERADRMLEAAREIGSLSAEADSLAKATDTINGFHKLAGQMASEIKKGSEAKDADA